MKDTPSPPPFRSPESTNDLRVERWAHGTAITGPGFHVWDFDCEAAMSWACHLAGRPRRNSSEGYSVRAPVFESFR